MIPFT